MHLAELPRDFLGLALVVLLLGVKHGFDPDHLAAIDGLTRFNALKRPRLARWAGVLFSLGHGLVVVAVALAVAQLAQAWQAPHWLEALGAWTSIAVLTLLALVNIVAVLRTPGHQMTALLGWRSGLFSRLLHSGSPWLVAAVGSVFALSFDSVSQAALLGMAATQFSGWQHASTLALVFTAGMLVTDGLNSWWIARLVKRADQTARIASRVLALAISGVGLLIAGMAAASRSLPAVDAWAEGKELWFGAAVMLVVLASYVLGQRLARARPEFTPASRVPSPATTRARAR